MWAASCHDFKNGCICTKENEGEWNEACLVNPECTLTGPAERVLSVAFSPDGKHVFIVSWDKVVKILNAETGEEVGVPHSFQGTFGCGATKNRLFIHQESVICPPRIGYLSTKNRLFIHQKTVVYPPRIG